MAVLTAARTPLTGLGASQPITAQTDSVSVIKQPLTHLRLYKENQNEMVEGESHCNTLGEDSWAGNK